MISENTRSIKNSKIRDMFNLALQYENPVNLTIGEPDFAVSDDVADAACKAIMEGKTKYSENAGVLPLRQKISRYLEEELDLSYDPKKEITVTTGAMGALFLTLKTIIDPGDQVIVNEPCWTNYMQQIMMCGGTPVSVGVKADFSIDVRAISEAVNEKTKAVILNSPCNPTGSIMEKEDLEKLADAMKDTNALVISDEVYKHLCFGETQFHSMAAIPGMKERTVVIDSFSKSHAMTGFRIGYAAGPEEVISNITKLQENMTACVSMPSQYAAIAALDGDRSHLNRMVETYRARRDYIMEKTEEIPFLSCAMPKGAFYAFLDIRDTGMGSEEFSIKLLEEKQIVVVPGTAFGEQGEGYIRLSFAASMDKLELGMEGIKRFIIENARNAR